MRIKKVIAFTTAVVVAFSGITYSGIKSEKVEAAQEWSLAWSDEFNGSSLDTSSWNYEIGNGNWGWGNGEKQYYTNRTQNLEVSNGTMKIKALKENYGGQNYTSARITTKGKKEFKYGRIEARMKLPSFSGSWPAFWMLGASGGWPGCGEIDIMEAINTENNTHGYVHWLVDASNSQGDSGTSSARRLPAGYNRTDWHTYGVEWDEKQIQWYVDDQVFFTQGITASHMSEFKRNQYIIFNLAIGGQWPGYTIDDTAFPSRSVMEVDYVRVYQKQEAPTTKYDGPMITVTQDSVQEFTDDWTTFFSNNANWTTTSGTVDIGDTPADGFTANITSVGKVTGDSVWGAQCNLEGLKYYPGATYKYTCTITSDKDKKIFVKVADEFEETVGGGLVELKAGVPYEFKADVTIPEDYEGKLSLKFGMGKTDGDTIADNGAVTINVKDISFATTTQIPDPNYVPPTTTKTPDTTVKSTSKKIAQTKVKKATKKKSSKKVKLTLKKINGVKGYQVAVYKTKKNAKKNKKALVKKFAKSIKVTIKSKKLKNKKKLYVRARAYVMNGKTKSYGKWSKVKRVNIKK